MNIVNILILAQVNCCKICQSKWDPAGDSTILKFKSNPAQTGETLLAVRVSVSEAGCSLGLDLSRTDI